MAPFGLLSVACCCMLFQFRQVVAPPPPIIEAFKPTNAPTTNAQDANSGFGVLNKFSDMLAKFQHKIDDINMRRKFMEAQMKAPFGILPTRMEAALDYTNIAQPTFTNTNVQLVSYTGVFLQIFPDGTANGTRDPTSPYAKLTLETVGLHSIHGKAGVKTVISGTKSKQYLTCSSNGNGKFYAVSKKSDMSVFDVVNPPKPTKAKLHLFWKSGKYHNFKCASNNKWMLAFRHNVNQLKKGKHTRNSQVDSWFYIHEPDKTKK